jgi:uncharacterized protein with FMN-binding domain
METFEIMKLTINMRLYQSHNSQDDNSKQKEFAEFLLKIGNGEYSTNSNTENMITLSADMTIPKGNLTDLADFVYPNLAKNSGNVNYMVGRAILTPKNTDVDIISDMIMSRLPGETRVYSSLDSTDSTENTYRQQSQIYSPEFLRSLKMSDLPPGELKLKTGIPIILLRNLNPLEGLCNGTRLIVHDLQSKVIDAEIITGSHIGKRVFIPRITLSPSESSLPFTLKRLQFPVHVAFSMTINRAQGQTLNKMGLYLPQPVFSHGQLYVALSRVISYQCIKVLILQNDYQKDCQTKNIVYKEIFQNT